ncbi:hypothetical protein GCM10010199_42470 [Dactylosporangium roseum]
MRAHPRTQRPGAELREGVLPPVGEHDGVRRLRAPVEPHHRVNLAGGAQVIDDGPLPAVPEPEVDNNDVHRRTPSVAHQLR